MITDEREERLPKWAQRQMNTLRMRLEERDARLAEGATDATVIWDNRPGDERYGMPPARPLGEVRDKIYFIHPETGSGYFTVHIDEDGVLEVFGTDSVAVEPRVSNVIRVRLTR